LLRFIAISRSGDCDRLLGPNRGRQLDSSALSSVSDTKMHRAPQRAHQSADRSAEMNGYARRKRIPAKEKPLTLPSRLIEAVSNWQLAETNPGLAEWSLLSLLSCQISLRIPPGRSVYAVCVGPKLPNYQIPRLPNSPCGPLPINLRPSAYREGEVPTATQSHKFSRKPLKSAKNREKITCATLCLFFRKNLHSG